MSVRVIPESEIESFIGEEVGISDWIEVTQERIDQFAESTGDHQWIHLDRERAEAESPYKTTIAHGFLSLSLLSVMASTTFRIDGGFRMGINYGLNRVRFPAPVPSGSRVRGRFRLQEIQSIEGGIQTVWAVTVEVEGGAKPCVAAEWVTRVYR